MRLLGVLLTLVLATSRTFADPVPFEIVHLLSDTGQVLVFDRAHNTHVLLQPGSQFGDYTVIEINDVSMTVEKQQERFVVYPREARTLTLTVYATAASKDPVLFSTTAPGPARVADAKAPGAKPAASAKAAAGIEVTEPRQVLAHADRDVNRRFFGFTTARRTCAPRVGDLPPACDPRHRAHHRASHETADSVDAYRSLDSGIVCISDDSTSSDTGGVRSR